MNIPKQPLDRTDPNFKNTIKAWLIHFRVIQEKYITAEGSTMQRITDEFAPFLTEAFKKEAAKKGHIDLTPTLLGYAITNHLTSKKENISLVREWQQIIREDDKNHLLYDIVEFASLCVEDALKHGLAYDLEK